ncbi:MAG: hypothetical protein ACOVOT_02405 [Rubrivivax sp.]|nr:hypothetical protein [Rubrivivax sp.]
MKFRDVVTPAGESFVVPQGIQRIDTRSTHGWQVRYQGTKMFSDGEIGARKALLKATEDLAERIATMPAPVSLQRQPSANKTSDLPAGVSGPILRTRRSGNSRSASFSVLLPVYGKPSIIRSIYIGSESTYSERYQGALERAVELRADAEMAYALAATLARRKAARGLKAAVRRSNAA